MKYLLFISVLILAAGCGTSTSSENSVDEIVDPYADPPGYSGDPFAGYGPVTTIRFPAETDIVIEIEENISSSGSWSVQVAACGSMDAALTLRDTVAAQTGKQVFIDHTGNYYKVRVGSFATSTDSDRLRIQLRANGFPDAWSVQR
ncbi:MAG: SPOR domain-containing protein [Candidatus Fermentibacteria bacterium]|nr:SPOR domain-containing protein [Candidatus Fermentibacteria bacterium]